MLTFGDVAKAFPDLEIVRSYDSLCVGTSGRSGLWFQGSRGGQSVGSRHRHPCAVQRVRAITSLEASATSTGPTVGDAADGLAAAFPQQLARDNLDYVELDGSDADQLTREQPCDASPKGRWRTAAILGRGRITGWYARLPEAC